MLDINRRKSKIFKGLTMSQYFEIYERKRRQKLKSEDRQLLKELTRNTLFCEHCYQPFSTSNINEEFTTPFIVLLDYISAISFVLVLTPVMLIFAFLALVNKIRKCFFVPDTDKTRRYTQSDCNLEVCLYRFIHLNGGYHCNQNVYYYEYLVYPSTL